MATWILFNSGASGIPVVSAMTGGEVAENLESSSRVELIAFLNRFDRAGSFLVARVGEAVESVNLLTEDASFVTNLNVSKTADTYRFFRDRNGQPVVVVMAGLEAVEIFRGNRKEALIDFLNKYPTATAFDVASMDADIPIIVAPPNHQSIYRGRGVMLEIGHGPGTRFDPGAIAPTGETEYNLNVIAANAAREVIVAAGVPCMIIDTPQANLQDLYNIGRQAAAFDVFCSVHHNAFDGPGGQDPQGTEVLVHRTKADAADRRLAAIMSRAMARALEIRDRGVKDNLNLLVLSGAEDTNVRATVLAELYFLDAPIANRRDWSQRVVRQWESRSFNG
ncbi:N-acetylmuramoyl-L-alanine amidase [Brunnivagina elsteri]|uniref:N-acetylmuramoyl-L-alanine amidase n=1 Tax=Brunnivagina elsteri CCALA 953 TaxID=987040 RepID=A0A2A2TF87_9CYAN|nr:N-acetylmuramoyl-L-alanine amidase [Calothrix elsteri]PAX52402.1 N-acetylmuramoyl-L-alanine amidase [Calothrix elsteri CCALA 953]